MRKDMATFATNFEQDWQAFSPKENWNRFHPALSSVIPFQDSLQQAPPAVD